MAKKDLKERIRDHCESYHFGFDKLALGMVCLFLLPNFVWWCYSPQYDLLRRTPEALGLYIAAFVFSAIALAVLLGLKRERPLRFDSASFLFACLTGFLYLAAWIFYLCAYVNFAVFAFLAVFPVAAFVCFAVWRANFLALLPIGIYGILNFVCFLLLLLIVV